MDRTLRRSRGTSRWRRGSWIAALALIAALPSSSQVAILFGDGFEGCSVSAWANTGAGGGAIGEPFAGEPDDQLKVRRYSGRCGLRAISSGSYVRDVSPANRTTYWARVYVYPAISSGAAQFMRFRRDGTGPDGQGNFFYWVTYNGSTQSFELFREGDASAQLTVAAPGPNRWYHVALRYSATPAEFRLSIHGAGGQVIANDLVVAHPFGSNQGVEAAEIGWVAGSGSGGIEVDDFVSTGGDSLGRRCRGDGDGSLALNVLDSIQVTREIRGTLATGQPDCNEDGAVDVQDGVCIRLRVLAEESCP